jgi:cytochrome c553
MEVHHHPDLHHKKKNFKEYFLEFLMILIKTTQVSFGKYLAMTTCTACHGPDVKGEEGSSPDLIIAAAYKREEFFKLIRTGVAPGGRNLGKMSLVAKTDLCYLNNKEINCICAYLQTKPLNY